MPRDPDRPTLPRLVKGEVRNVGVAVTAKEQLELARRIVDERSRDSDDRLHGAEDVIADLAQQLGRAVERLTVVEAQLANVTHRVAALELGGMPGG